MLPEIWIFDTYSILLLIGAIAALFIYHIYGKKAGLPSDYVNTIEIVAIISIISGLVGAVLFQTLYDLLNHDVHFGSMTFYGGLIFGALCFLLIYKFYVMKKYPNIKFTKAVLAIAPASITIAHGFGRIGCFCAGCCYGVETDSWLGVKFPDLPNPVYPTQLFEAIFLFLLFGVLFYIAIKKQTKYTMVIYLFAYGLWRFLIEFIRGDERGYFLLGLAPSQWMSIFAILIGIGLIIYFNIHKNNTKENASTQSE